MSSDAPVLKLYNTLTRAKEEFRPLDPANVRMYVCGPTVYDYAHIGNARPIIVFDVLFRLLRHLYGADHVTYVRNITDVDDKINARAAERGITIRELTEGTNKIFQEDVKALGCLEPTVQPRATEHIAEMIALIEKMIAAGHAYAADGHVLFDVPSMADYGRLSRRPLDEMIAGARVDVAPYKRGDMDFVLWKPSKESEPGWESPWGRGRPGWHLECSAMSWKHLGEVFDIHGGGIDLVFPHHENEIAQTRCAFGHEAMANYWMHNGFLQVEGEKMSKSLGNFVTINELLHTENFGGRKWPGEVLRLAMLRTHYRQPIDFTVKALEEAEASLRKWSAQIGEVSAGPAAAGEVLNALADDLNTPLALASLHELDAAALDGALKLFGIDIRAYRQWVEGETKQAVDVDQVSSLISSRLAARAAKNWAESDRIRDELAAMGVALKDNKDGTTTWEVKR
ncbi:cysteine--tRNA ligase [Methylosinus sporium]|uniref:Cysteine--tRNA ligase n=1 Tax=Methylosinus sporium TaxID=428 RepID=A0A2U1SQA1_METSR|nr:cysteine--tRNA ligase [Methylosinus sporium]PWB93775.1 cysteine--tRNA ligase [Methylosinus sporium]